MSSYGWNHRHLFLEETGKRPLINVFKGLEKDLQKPKISLPVWLWDSVCLQPAEKALLPCSLPHVQWDSFRLSFARFRRKDSWYHCPLNISRLLFNIGKISCIDVKQWKSEADKWNSDVNSMSVSGKDFPVPYQKYLKILFKNYL